MVVTAGDKRVLKAKAVAGTDLGVADYEGFLQTDAAINPDNYAELRLSLGR